MNQINKARIQSRGVDRVRVEKWPRLDAERKRFREHLNQLGDEFGNDWKNRGTDGVIRGQRSRRYGDYLYAQDRDMFEMSLDEWQKRSN